MPTSSTCAPRPVLARGEAPVNSPSAEALRRRIQHGLPYGSVLRVAVRLGRAERTVYAQVEGEHPLTVAVAVEALRELPAGAAREALGELLAPAGLAVIQRPGATREVGSVLGANGGLLSAVAAVEEAIGAGLADGVLETGEVLRIVAALTEARCRLEALLGTITTDDQRSTVPVAAGR